MRKGGKITLKKGGILARKKKYARRKKINKKIGLRRKKVKTEQIESLYSQGYNDKGTK